MIDYKERQAVLEQIQAHCNAVWADYYSTFLDSSPLADDPLECAQLLEHPLLDYAKKYNINIEAEVWDTFNKGMLFIVCNTVPAGYSYVDTILMPFYIMSDYDSLIKEFITLYNTKDDNAKARLLYLAYHVFKHDKLIQEIPNIVDPNRDDDDIPF